MSLSPNQHTLATLVRSFHPVVAIESSEEERVQACMTEIAAELGLPVFEWSITRGLCRPPRLIGVHNTEQPIQLLAHMETLAKEGVYILKDFTSHLNEPGIIRQFREVAQQFSRNRSTIVLISQDLNVPRDVEHLTTNWELPPPDYHELRAELRTVVKELKQSRRIQVNLDSYQLDELVKALHGMTLDAAHRAIRYALEEDGQLSAKDILNIQDRKAERIRRGGLLEYFAPENNMSALGGFKTLKEWLHRAKVGFTSAAAQLNLSPPKGICIVGVQGCGKSLAVKAIAREWKLPLLKLDAGRIYDKYVGESEKNFRRAIAMAEGMSPVILWIDEIEKAISSKGGGEDAGLSQRLLGTFLTWLQEKKAVVFVVATANDLSILPPELLRKGRFDEIFFVDLPVAEERLEILKIHLQKRKQLPEEFELHSVVTATNGFSGAEIEQAILSGLYQSLYTQKPFSTDTLLDEIEKTVPLSISRREDILRLQALARDRFVNVH